MASGGDTPGSTRLAHGSAAARRRLRQGWRAAAQRARRPHAWGILIVALVLAFGWYRVQGWYAARLIQEQRRYAQEQVDIRAEALALTVRSAFLGMAAEIPGQGLLVLHTFPLSTESLPASARVRVALYRHGAPTREVTRILDLSRPLGPGIGDRWAVAARDMTRQVLFGDPRTFRRDPVMATVPLPDGYWELAVVPVGGWGAAIGENLVIFRAGSALASLLALALVWGGLRSGYWLRRAIAERTAELQRSEERYRLLFERLPIGLYRNDLGGRIMDANPALVEMLRFADRESLLAANGRELWLDLAEREQVIAALEREGELRGYERRIRRADGTSIWVRSDASVVHDDEGKALYVEGSAEDVTAEHEAREALVASEKRYRALFEDVPVGVFRVTRFGHILDLNPAALRVLGCTSPEDAIGQMAERFWGDAEERGRLLGELDRCGSAVGFEVRIHRLDGTLRWGSINARLIENEAGEVAWIEGTVEDITARREAEVARQQSEAQVRALLNASSDTAILIDSEGLVLAANEAAARNFGLGVSEFVGTRVRYLAPREVSARRWAYVRQVLDTAQPVRFRDERAGMHFENTLYPVLDADGRVHQIAIYARDVTDRDRALARLRESEARSRALFENMGDAFVLLDQDLTVVEYRDAAAPVLGLTAEQVVGRPFGEAFAPCVLGGAELDCADLSRALRAGQTLRRSDIVWRAGAAGGGVYLDLSAYRIYDSEKPRLAVLLRDVSHRHMLERMRRQRERLEALAQFAAGVAHDFGNLLSTITLAATMLDEDIPTNDASHHDVEAIADAAEKGRRMVVDLVAFCRGEPMIMELLDLGLLLQQRGAGLSRLLGGDVALRLAVADGPLTFRGNEVRLVRVLDNLVINAREAMPTGGTLSIQARAAALDETTAAGLGVAPGPYVALIVSDTGVGIAPEDLPRIFDPFWTTRRGLSRGLGLAAVHGIVQQHGGAIRVDSVVGEGTTFVVYLPAEPVDVAILDEAE